LTFDTSSYNYPKIAGKVGSPTGDFHPISSRPCWAYPKNPADHLKRHFFCKRTAKKLPLQMASDLVVQAVEKPKRPHKFVKIGRHKQGVP